MRKQTKKASGRIYYKTTESYNGVKFLCIGTSRTGKLEAKKNWAKNLERKKKEIDGNIERKEHRERFSAAIRFWYDTYKSHKGYKGGKRSPRTLRTDNDTLNQLEKVFGSEFVCDITSDMIQAYFNMLGAGPLSKSTIKKRWNMLSMFCRHVYPYGGNPMLPCTPVYPDESVCIDDVTDEESAPKLAYTDAEIEKLLHELGQPYNPVGRKSNGIPRGYINGNILIVILFQFLRAGEAIELRVKDVNLAQGELHIMRQYDDESHTVMLPKYRSTRKLPISEVCFPILAKACHGKEPNDLVFPAGTLNAATAHDGRMMLKDLRVTLYSAADKLGLAHHTVHDLRHDGISRLVRHGAKPTSIQRWAGHKSLTMTLDRYYRHSGEEDQEDVALMRGIAV